MLMTPMTRRAEVQNSVAPAATEGDRAALPVFRVRSRDERLEGSSFPAWVDCGAATITHYRPHSPVSG